MNSVEDWMSLARQDLNAATILAKAPVKFVEDGMVCYHTHQAVEKCLKALIRDCGEDPAYIHDLIKLRDTYLDLSHTQVPVRFNKAFANLQPCEMEVKYVWKTDLPPYSRQELVALAEDFFIWTEKQL